jgi:hypothetical protein
MKKILPIEDWKSQRTASGEFYHPVFFENYDSSLQYQGLLEEANLETTGWYLGEGYPKSKEVGLRSIYDHGPLPGGIDCYDSIREWDPSPESIPETADPLRPWFILWIADTEEGPWVSWARQKSQNSEDTQDES